MKENKAIDEKIERAMREAEHPVTGEVSRDWIRRRVRYRHPLLYWFTMHSPSGRMMKRAMDAVGSGVALLMLAPVFLVTAAAILIEDRGPVFFRQVRVGEGGRHFDFWKFRSMVTNAEELKAKLAEQNESAQGVIFKIKDDPRITRVGRFIRKYSIDELPQFVNVLNGQMSLVGPRPPVPKEVALYDDASWRRLAVIPGLTCLWQIGGRSNIGFDDQVKLDAAYALTQNVFTDFVLVFKTVPAVLKGEGAF